MKSTKTTQTELGQHSCRESDYSGGKQTDNDAKCNCTLELLACWENGGDQFAA